MEMQVVKELILQSLEHEMGGVEIYETALKCVQNEDLKEEWERYHQETERHVQILHDVLSQMQLDPQELASVSERQAPPQLWNPGAHGNVHLLATHAGSVPGGAFAVQSTQTLTPQSSGVFVQDPPSTFAVRVAPRRSAGSFEPLPQAIDDSTETMTISLAMKVFPRGRFRSSRRS